VLGHALSPAALTLPGTAWFLPTPAETKQCLGRVLPRRRQRGLVVPPCGALSVSRSEDGPYLYFTGIALDGIVDGGPHRTGWGPRGQPK
jgi:hypothetical protein